MDKIYNNLKGFSLYEMAIVVTILSILIGAIYALVPAQLEQRNLDNNRVAMDRLQAALDTYLNQKGYLPCPAARDAALSSASFGVATDCSVSAPTGTSEVGAGDDTIRIGVVPTRELGLPDYYMMDSWNNRITYATVKKFATSNTDFVNTNPTATAIAIQDASGNAINNTPVAYVLISHGKIDNGATNNSGSTKTCVAGTTESPNCDLTSNIFVDAFYNSSGAAFYDDYIRWKTKALQIRDSSYIGGGSALGGLSFSKFALITDQKVAGASAQSPGALVANTWYIRDLNTIRFQTTPSPVTSVNSSTGEVTLPAGKYYIRATSTAQGVSGNRLRVFNVTDGIEEALGLSNSGDMGGASVAVPTTVNNPTVVAYVNYTSPKSIRIEHFIAANNATLGNPSTYEFGYPVSNSGDEVYTTLEIFGQ